VELKTHEFCGPANALTESEYVEATMGENKREGRYKCVCLLPLTFLKIRTNPILGPTATEEGKTRPIMVMQVRPPSSPSSFYS
jgi:hypothetical protein